MKLKAVSEPRKEHVKLGKVVVADSIPQEALEIMERDLEIEEVSGNQKALMEKIAEADALVVRSQTKVTRDLLQKARRLRVVARAGVGVDNVDVEAATERGIVVVNSPEGNTVSAAEHTFAMILSIMRKIPQAHASLREGKWERGKFVGSELYNKTLGVIGLGKIGREVALRAQSFRMKVVAFDPFVTEKYALEIGVPLLSLEDLLKEADIVTLHLPLTGETRHLLGEKQISLMKRGGVVVNVARGGIVEEQALCTALQSGQVAGAALDVFEEEPPLSSPLLKLDNVVVTPHLGASTEEAQIRVARDVAEQIVDLLRGRPARSPVNIPSFSPEILAFFEPYLILVEKLGLFLAQLSEGPIHEVRLMYLGEIGKEDVAPMTSVALKGLLSFEMGESVNFVNAPYLSRTRGIKVQESKSETCEGYRDLIIMKVKTPKGKYSCAGTVFQTEPRIVEIEGYQVNVIPRGCKLLTWQNDRPGVVGRVGTLLGKHDINIAEMQVGREKVRAKAVMVLSVDEPVRQELVAEISRLDGIEDAKVVIL